MANNTVNESLTINVELVPGTPLGSVSLQGNGDFSSFAQQQHWRMER